MFHPDLHEKIVTSGEGIIRTLVIMALLLVAFLLGHEVGIY